MHGFAYYQNQFSVDYLAIRLAKDKMSNKSKNSRMGFRKS